MNNESKQIWCPVDLPITGFTLTLADAHTLRGCLAGSIKDFERALVLDVGVEGLDAVAKALPAMRTKLAKLDAAIQASKLAYARKQLAKA